MVGKFTLVNMQMFHNKFIDIQIKNVNDSVINITMDKLLVYISCLDLLSVHIVLKISNLYMWCGGSLICIYRVVCLLSVHFVLWIPYLYISCWGSLSVHLVLCVSCIIIIF